MEDAAGRRRLYEITVEGRLDSRWSEWLEGLALSYPGASITVLRGTLPDQAALLGVLKKVHNLGLHLVSVARLCSGEGEEDYD